MLILIEQLEFTVKFSVYLTVLSKVLKTKDSNGSLCHLQSSEVYSVAEMSRYINGRWRKCEFSKFREPRKVGLNSDNCPRSQFEKGSKDTWRRSQQRNDYDKVGNGRFKRDCFSRGDENKRYNKRNQSREGYRKNNSSFANNNRYNGYGKRFGDFQRHNDNVSKEYRQQRFPSHNSSRPFPPSRRRRYDQKAAYSKVDRDRVLFESTKVVAADDEDFEMFDSTQPDIPSYGARGGFQTQDDIKKPDMTQNGFCGNTNTSWGGGNTFGSQGSAFQSENAEPFATQTSGFGNFGHSSFGGFSAKGFQRVPPLLLSSGLTPGYSELLKQAYGFGSWGSDSFESTDMMEVDGPEYREALIRDGLAYSDIVVV